MENGSIQVTEIINIMKEELEGSPLRVNEIAESQTAAEPRTPKQSEAKKKAEDKFIKEAASMGLSEEQARKLLATRTVNKEGQRHLPKEDTACSPEMIAYHDGRTDEDCQVNVLRSMKRDGGPTGLKHKLESLISGYDNDADRAQAAYDEFGKRLARMRLAMVCAINEARRRKAVAEDKDPKTITYLEVNGD